MPKPIALDKPECKFPGPSEVGVSLASPLCFSSVIPHAQRLQLCEFLPFSPIAELCVLGCSECEIPSLSVVTEAWNLLLYATAWFVVSLNMTVQVSANTTAG